MKTAYRTLAVALIAVAILTVVAMPTFAAPASETYQVATDKNHLQPGDTLRVIATIKQATPGCAYSVTLSVTGPGGVSATDQITVNTLAGGNGHTPASFPSDFSGIPNTDTAGTYSVTASFICNYVTGSATTTFVVSK
jgi:hypothetical protein